MQNPYDDDTKPKPLANGEREIMVRLQAGEKLHLHRHYNFADEDEAIYSWTFFWDYNDHPYDHHVWLLMMRGLIRPVTCAGGAIWFQLTEEGSALVKDESKSKILVDHTLTAIRQAFDDPHKRRVYLRTLSGGQIAITHAIEPKQGRIAVQITAPHPEQVAIAGYTGWWVYLRGPHEVVLCP